MQKVQPISVVIAGDSYVLGRDRLERAAQGLLPEPLRDHYAVVGGVRFPPKQLIAEVTGVDRADFTTNQARAILRRLGFATARVSDTRKPARRTAEATVPYRSGEADRLRPHLGQWVAVKGGDVLVAAETPDRVLAWLRTHGKRADSMFRVPIDPSVDLGGFPG
jgi:hypothetical protein